MKIIGFIETRQEEMIREILEHGGLGRDSLPRVPPAPRRQRKPRPFARRGIRTVPPSSKWTPIIANSSIGNGKRIRLNCPGRRNRANDRFIRPLP